MWYALRLFIHGPKACCITLHHVLFRQGNHEWKTFDTNWGPVNTNWWNGWLKLPKEVKKCLHGSTLIRAAFLIAWLFLLINNLKAIHPNCQLAALVHAIFHLITETKCNYVLVLLLVLTVQQMRVKVVGLFSRNNKFSETGLQLHCSVLTIVNDI